MPVSEKIGGLPVLSSVLDHGPLFAVFATCIVGCFMVYMLMSLEGVSPLERSHYKAFTLGEAICFPLYFGLVTLVLQSAQKFEGFYAEKEWHMSVLGICLLVAVTKRFNIHQIEAVMFGSLLTVTDADLLLLLVLGLAVALVLAWHYNGLLLDSLNPPLARVAGFPTGLLDYLFVVLLTVAIVVSLKVIGALLVEALVVVPAASGRNLARGTKSYLLWSIACALVAGFGGLAVSTVIQVPSGGAVVLVLSSIFFVTLGVGALARRWSADS